MLIPLFVFISKSYKRAKENEKVKVVEQTVRNSEVPTRGRSLQTDSMIMVFAILISIGASFLWGIYEPIYLSSFLHPLDDMSLLVWFAFLVVIFMGMKSNIRAGRAPFKARNVKGSLQTEEEAPMPISSLSKTGRMQSR